MCFGAAAGRHRLIFNHLTINHLCDGEKLTGTTGLEQSQTHALRKKTTLLRVYH